MYRFEQTPLAIKDDPDIALSWPEICTFFGIQYKTRKSGVIVILCVYHKEKTASLHLWPESGRFHCHGCGVDGDKIDFCAAMTSSKTLVQLASLFDIIRRAAHRDGPGQLYLKLSTSDCDTPEQLFFKL